LLSLLGLDTGISEAENLAKGLKELRMGDVLELFLDEKLERKILNEETFNVKKE
jgi:2-isopropylmalate synthase